MKKSATIVDNYRYDLIREWNEDRPKLRVCMLNPSTADAFKDDPTIRRLIGFASRENYGGIVVVNLYAFRSSKPLNWKHDHIGPENNETIRRVCFDKTVLCAWGANAYEDRVEEVMDIFENNGIETVCLGTTKDGHPRHPLYVKADHPFLPFKALKELPQ